MRQIGEWIARVLADITNVAVIQEVGREVEAMASQYPLYPA
jgi:glycine/serine hydroxymethyltransferase